MLKYISSPFKWFFRLEAASGLVLLFAAVVALIISNSNFSDLYFSTLNKYLFVFITILKHTFIITKETILGKISSKLFYILFANL